VAILIGIAVATVVVILIIVVDRPQEVMENPLRHSASLQQSGFVCSAEVDALVDAHDDHVLGHVRETLVMAIGLDGARERTGEVDREFVRLEVERQRAGNGPVEIVCPRGVIGIVRGVSSGSQVGSPTVLGLPSRSPSRMAVMGRQKV
jgi:hypothetical protein